MIQGALTPLSLSPSLPIQSNEPTRSALHFNVSSIASWSDSQTFKESYYVVFHHILSSGHFM